MIEALTVPFACALLLGALTGPFSRRAAPKAGAGTLVAVTLAVAIATDTALVVLVGARLLDAAPLAEALRWRAERPRHIPVPVPVSVAAGAALVLIAAAARSDWRRAQRQARRWRAVVGSFRARELLVLHSTAALAYAVPGSRGRAGGIVVSDSMLRALDSEERRVLLAHERSHLRHRHDRYQRLVRIAARISPLVRRSLDATLLLTERWADEDAARAVGSDRTAARAIARAALLRADERPQVAQAGFAAHLVSTRIDALISPTSGRGSRLVIAVAALLGTAAILGATIATHDLGHLFDLLRGDG